MKGWLWKYGLIIILFIMLFGCSSEEEMSWLFFSRVPSDAAEQIKDNVEEANAGLEELSIKLYSPAYERLINEIAAHNGDILIIDESLLYPAILDPEGLVPLDGVLDQAITVPSKYKATHPETGENHVYALPIDKDSPLLDGINAKSKEGLIALIPIYSNHSDVSIAALKKVVATD